jgi:hypothetical protein
VCYKPEDIVNGLMSLKLSTEKYVPNKVCKFLEKGDFLDTPLHNFRN